jgi:hypothetical protein
MLTAAADACVCAQAVELTREECLEMLGKVLPEIKRLRKLQQQQDLSKADVLERTKKYLHAIGQHIEVVVAQHGAGVVEPLWDFVSRAILNGLSGDKLERLYTKIKSSHAAGGGLLLLLGERAASCAVWCSACGERLHVELRCRWAHGVGLAWS